MAVLVTAAAGGALLWTRTRGRRAPPAPPPPGREKGRTVLGLGSCWRGLAVTREMVVPLDLLREVKPGAAGPRSLMEAFGGPLRAVPPPRGWTAVDFDDSDWARSPGPFRGGILFTSAGRYQFYLDVSGLLCLRGKFRVENPAAVRKLTLSLEYRGGVVACLNGREVLRRHLPGGKIEAGTPGAAYPREAYARPAGSARDRRAGPRELPAGLLRRGINVLALELHRSDFRPEALKWKRWYAGYRDGWPHVGLSSLRLAAESAPGAIVPNLSRPAGVRVWNQDVHRVFSAAEYGDPCERLRPVRLVGARGGSYSGQVVVGSTSKLAGLKAAAGGLVRAGGGGEIPAAAVRVRYPRLSRCGMSAARPGLSRGGQKELRAFSALEAAPPAGAEPLAFETDPGARARLDLPAEAVPGAVQPVWVTVAVPRGIPAGKYAGTLRVSAGGRPLCAVPLELEVVDWTLPPARDFGTFMGVYQSPESLAVQYGVPLWSEKHWKLVEESLRLAGQLGNGLVVVPLLNRTQFGNDRSMVAWVARKDGSYAYDWQIHDRYLALAAKHGRPRVISYQVWSPAAVWQAAPEAAPRFVTVIDGATGRRGALKLPRCGTRAAKRLWTPLLREVEARLKKLGLEDALVLGIHSDAAVPDAVAATFRGVFPRAGWHRVSHPAGPTSWSTRVGGARVSCAYAYREYLLTPRTVPPPGGKRRPVPAGKRLLAMSQRTWLDLQQPLRVRTMPERALLVGASGVGRLGIDYWPVAGSTASTRSLFARWPDSDVGQTCPRIPFLAAPGRDGPVATVRLEALREGLQEAEARIFIEKALAAGKLDGALARKCRALLDRRVTLCRIKHEDRSPTRFTFGRGWRERSAGLYRLAAEVAAALRD